MEEAPECLLVGGDEILLLEVVDVGGGLVVLPLVHDLVGVLGVVGRDFAVDEFPLGDVVVGGLVVAQLGLDQESVAGAVPGHISLLVLRRH